MPKAAPATKSRSPKKAPISAAFVDDEAQESDDSDGVLVNRPASESRDTPPAYASGYHDHDSNVDEGNQESEDNFINDGDPYEGYQSDGAVSATYTPPPSPAKSRTKRAVVDSPSPTPPSTPIKNRVRQAATKALLPPAPKKTPSKGNTYAKDNVIELESTSEEDLEAMDVDDSEFKKPAGVKPASLPPSLVTRSAASKRSLVVADSASGEKDGTASKRVKTKPDVDDARESLASSGNLAPKDASFDPYGSNQDMAKMMGAFLAFIKDNPGMVPAAATTGITDSDRAASAGPSTAPQVSKTEHVDHDDIALQEGIRSSLESPLRLKKSGPRYSPDWDPPDIVDVLEEVQMKKRAQTTASASPKKSKTGSESTGRKAVSSKVVDVEGISSNHGRAKPAVKSVASKYESDDEHVQTISVKKGKGKNNGRDVNSDEKFDPNSKNKVVNKGKGKAKVRANSDDDDGPVQKKPKDLSAYLLVKKFPVVSAAVGDEDGKPPVTMAQYMRMARGETEPEEESPESPAADNDEPPVFLEELEAYKAFFDPKAKCGVFDVKLQDPTMRPHYVGLPPLPGGRMLLAAFDPKRNSTDDVDYRTGGRVAFGEWVKVVPRMLASNSMGSMLFIESGDRYINLSRCSPLGLSAHTSAGSSQTVRLQIGDRVAICVTPVCVTESCLFAPKAVGRGDRYRKWMMGITHDYDHERLVSMLSLVFGEPILYAQMVDKAISFQTMLSPANDSGRTPDAHHSRSTRSVPSPSLFSSQSPSKATSSRRSNTNNFGKTLLSHNDTVPIYDARKIVVDFNTDLDRLEIPVSSFVVVGYTVSCYNGAVSGSSAKAANVSFNILWAIVCGTPSPPSRT
ncbi:hypothetical protein C8R43DRAFT_960035 [Mycena crocata]|nr:hypothetical protein C8R43DRAFT_960035 [Mycena crocata]